jgi:Asp-tRNA(Asn)/Glu-tRNA(Gln) amidotransferase A subunit family amidase
LAEEGLVGPLHGIPVLVKDQVKTAGLRTTFGSEAFDEYVPGEDATVVSRLREAGAVVLGKTNMPDWAAGLRGFSSVLGQTKNPYDLDRDPGGSSAGTGAAVAANLGTVGIGEDTGGSIRVPASCCNLFGIRVTTGLVSRSGLSPLVEHQDTPGPMARTVPDLARVLDAIAGYDSTDRRTGVGAIRRGDGAFLDSLDAHDLADVRLGVLRQAFDREAPTADAVTAVVESAMDDLAAAGVTFVDPVSIPNLDEHLSETALYALQAKHDINGFLRDLEDAPVESVEELHRTGRYHERQALFERIAAGPDDPTDRPEYWRKVTAQAEFQRVVCAVHAAHDLDGILFPDVAVLPQRTAAIRSGEATREEFLVNTFVASQSSCPAVSMPGGFTDSGVPVGVEVMGPPYSDARLLSIARGYEQVADPRDPPAL